MLIVILNLHVVENYRSHVSIDLAISQTMVGKSESRLTSIKGILILGASIVCDLNASSTLIGILIEI